MFTVFEFYGLQHALLTSAIHSSESLSVIKDGWKIPCFNGGFYLGKSPIFLWSMASSAMFEDSLRDPESQGPRAYSAYSLVPFQGDPLVRSGPPLHCKLVIASMWVSCRKSMHNTKCRNPNKPLKKCRF